MATNLEAVKILCDGSIKASILILRDRGIDTKTIDAGKLSDALKTTLKTNLDQIMKDWQDAINANMSEGWLRELINVQCNEMAINALRENGWIK
jgi:hypothetical protein